MTQLHRRGLITGLGAIICAPAIVRASSLMPVKAIEPAGKLVVALGDNVYKWQWYDGRVQLFGTRTIWQVFDLKTQVWRTIDQSPPELESYRVE